MVVIGPTRELVMQIYDCLKDLIDNMGGGLSVGVVMGGVPRKTEEIKLSKGKNQYLGINMLVATPGRLLDHL